MNAKLNIVQGKVAFLMRAGKDWVLDSMPDAEVAKIIENGKIEDDSPFPQYPIHVGDYYFSGKKLPPKRTKAK